MSEQSKAMSAQLDHLRRSTQLSAVMTIFEEWQAPELRDAYDFVMTRFSERMQDPHYREEALARAADPKVHKELVVLRNGERIGTLIRTGLLDDDALHEYGGQYMREIWQRLEPLVQDQRRVLGIGALWENFEYFATRAGQYFDRNRGTQK